MIQWILKDPAGLQSIKLFNGILDKGQRCAAIISCPWSLQQLQWQREALGIVGYWLGGVSRWDCRSSRGGFNWDVSWWRFLLPCKKGSWASSFVHKGSSCAAVEVLVREGGWGQGPGDCARCSSHSLLPPLASTASAQGCSLLSGEWGNVCESWRGRVDQKAELD